MSKKTRRYQKRQRPKSRTFTRGKGATQGYRQLDKRLIALLYNLDEPVSINTIVKKLSSGSWTKKEINSSVTTLLKSKQIVISGKRKFVLNRSLKLYEGILEKHPKGFGFVVELESQHSHARFSKDPFLSPARMGSANHGDKILIRITRTRNNGRSDAEIISVLERNIDTLTGFFISGPSPLVIPEDPRHPSPIHILQDQKEFPEDGYAVIIKFLPSSKDERRYSGKIIEVLGPPGSIDVQMRLVIEKFKLPSTFDRKALQETEQLEEAIQTSENRLDLRDIDHITIDGESAKDFDDAISVIKTRKGFRLYVSIADVSYYVKAGTTLDTEAYQRGTSIYFPGRVIPMLPEKLSNDLCSLVPHEDRRTFTAILDFDRQGKRLKKQFSKSIIRSRHRFTYTTVKKILIDKEQETRREHKPFLTPLKWACELATELLRKRLERGAIGFNIPEPEISLEDDGNIHSITRTERNFAHQIIEEFMLAANEAVAEMFTEHAAATLYRIHEPPSPEKVDDFKTFAQTLDLHLPQYQDDPAWFGKVLELVKDSPKEYVVNTLLLRTMQQARYDSTNHGHFGLASTDYTHFTSPIRRYPDLLVHRNLEALVADTARQRSGKAGKKGLKEIGLFLSKRERTAIDAGREMNERLQLFFMEKYIGESFDAIISGVTGFAFFVELVDLFISGSVDLSLLTNDYYLHDARHHRLIGEVTGHIYSLGTTLKVTLVSVDHEKRRINFAPAEGKEHIK